MNNVKTKPPTWMSAIAKALYKKIVPLLADLHASALDTEAITSYCQHCADYAEAQAMLRKEGKTIETLQKGFWVAGGRTRASTVKLVYRSRDRSVLNITLREGRNRQVRRMLASLGHRVRRLKRIALGRMTIRGLSVGRYRRLTAAEVAYLRSLGAERKEKRRSKAK